MRLTDIAPGTRIRVRESVVSPSRGPWTATTEGELIDVYVEKRSALHNAFASSPSGELPLLRVRLKLDDGSLTDLVIDHTAEIVVLK